MRRYVNFTHQLYFGLYKTHLCFFLIDTYFQVFLHTLSAILNTTFQVFGLSSSIYCLWVIMCLIYIFGYSLFLLFWIERWSTYFWTHFHGHKEFVWSYLVLVLLMRLILQLVPIIFCWNAIKLEIRCNGIKPMPYKNIEHKKQGCWDLEGKGLLADGSLHHLEVFPGLANVYLWLFEYQKHN